MTSIAIIDYGMGNLKSVSKALEHVGASATITRDAAEISKADKIILPGVGAFGHCMENLRQFNLIDPIKVHIGSGKYFLGICLGLQLLFDESEEFGPVKGLGILKGKVKKFNFTDHKIPHMGWNQINTNGSPALLKDIPNNSSFYFVHSYYVEPTDHNIVSTSTDYGINFCSSVQKNNVMACQFHPEKSQKLGLKILENFIKL